MCFRYSTRLPSPFFRETCTQILCNLFTTLWFSEEDILSYMEKDPEQHVRVEESFHSKLHGV